MSYKTDRKNNKKIMNIIKLYKLWKVSRIKMISCNGGRRILFDIL